MRPVLISAAVLDKLWVKHGVDRREVEQCFENRIGTFLEDAREDHRTDPPSLWFIAPTNKGRMLKIVFMFVDGNIHIKSAFEPNAAETSIYDVDGR